MGVADYEMTAGVDLDFNVNDSSEIIYLRNNQKESISVESYQNLPDELKLNKDEITDEKMEAFSREGHLKGAKKNSQGSPKVEIVYNLEIQRIDERELDKWK
ncbi:hypothetical protein MK490_10390 [Streptococcus gordonii]|nr:hypothetical protein [Streptococcus gordonii]